MKKLLLFTGLLYCVTAIRAQGIYDKVEYDFPGQTSSQVSHVATYDNGILFVTKSSLATGAAFLNFVKSDSAGNIQWKKSVTDDGLQWSSVVQSADSGYILSGRTIGSLGGLTVIKLDKAGNLVFDKNTSLLQGTWLVDIPVTQARNNNHFYLATGVVDGTTGMEAWSLMEFDENGNTVMSYVYHQMQDYSQLVDIDTCDNGDILLLGGQSPAVKTECPKVDRISPSGQLIWSKRYDMINVNRFPLSFQQLPGDFIYITTHYFIFPTFIYGMSYMKIDGAGNIVWSRHYNAGSMNPATNMVTNNNETCILAHNNPNTYYFLMRLDTNGQALCSRAILGTEEYYSVSTLNANDFCLFAIDTNNRIIKTTVGACGEGCSDSTVNITHYLLPQPVIVTDSIAIPILVTQSVNSPSITIPTVHSTPLCSTVNVTEPLVSAPSVYPLPANDFIMINSGSQAMTAVSITNMQGQCVRAISCNSSSSQVDVSALAEGLYFATVVTAAGCFTYRVMIVH